MNDARNVVSKCGRDRKSPALAVSLIVIALLGSFGCVRRERSGSEPTPRRPLTVHELTDLESIGVPVYPGARLARRLNGVPAPIPGGVAYMFHLVTTDPEEKVIAYYMTSLREPVKVTGGAPFVVGRTQGGDEVTVLPEKHEIVIKRGGGRPDVRRTQTEILVTVRVRTRPSA